MLFEVASIPAFAQTSDTSSVQARSSIHTKIADNIEGDNLIFPPTNVFNLLPFNQLTLDLYALFQDTQVEETHTNT